MVPFLDLSITDTDLLDEIHTGIKDVIAKSAFILSKPVQQFEDEFAAYIGAKHCIGVACGTDALTIGMRALDIGAGDEVILMATTFIAAAEAIKHVGATPVIVDIDPATRNFNFETLDAAVTPRTKAVIATHLYGQPIDLDACEAFAERHRIHLIEDAAQAHGARFKDVRVGNRGIVSCFSFYPGKNLGACGDGGAITTNDELLAKRMRALRNHGCTIKYQHDEVGYNSRLDGMQAVVLSAKLKRLDAANEQRRAAANRYSSLLSMIPNVTLPPIIPNTEAIHHLYVIEVAPEHRDALMKFLEERGVHTGIHYPYPIHRTGSFAYLGIPEGALPIAERYANSIISLPMFPSITEMQQQEVADGIASYFAQIR